MMCFPSGDARNADGGYTTAVFAGLTFMIALVASASLLLARQQLMGAEHEADAAKERFDFEGRAMAAALRLIQQDGAPTLRWTEPGATGDVTVTLEPESLKIAPDQLTRPDNRDLIAGFVGPAEAAAVETNSATLRPAADGVIHRWQLAALGTDRRWRECAATLTSPYTRLTAFALPAPGRPSGGERNGGPNRRSGELWRVTVDGTDGAWLDRVVRMTGVSADPIAVVDDAFGRAPGNRRLDCLTDLVRLAGRPL